MFQTLAQISANSKDATYSRGASKKNAESDNAFPSELYANLYLSSGAVPASKSQQSLTLQRCEVPVHAEYTEHSRLNGKPRPWYPESCSLTFRGNQSPRQALHRILISDGLWGQCQHAGTGPHQS